MRLRESRTPLGAVVLTTLLLNVLWPAVARGADEALDLVLASHPASDTLDVEVACPPVVTFRGTFDAVVLLRNRGPEPRSVTRGALTLHAGALRVTGPRAFSVSLTVPAAGADGTPGRASTSVPILAPPTALRGSVLSVGLGLFGPTGPSGRRHLLATGACTVEISTVDTPVLTRIEVFPGAATIAEGQTQGFVARGGFSDGSVDTPLAGVVWSSHAQAVATIGGTGVATGVGVGTAAIRASRDGVRSAEATLTVTPPVIASIAVSPPIATIDAGGTLQYHATATLTDGSTLDVTADVVWSSHAEAVARITAAALATGVGSGTATITARHASGVLGIATLAVAGAAGPPSIAGVSPARGSSLGGTRVTISGGNLIPETTVRVGGVPATDVVLVSPSVLTATTPAGSPGLTVDVTVDNAQGSATLTGGFSYVFPFSIPGAVAVETGTTGALTVSLVEPAGVATTVTVTSANSGVATLPASAGVAVGQRTVDVPVTAGVTTGTATVTVTIGGVSLSTVVFVYPPFSTVCAGIARGSHDPPVATSCGADVVAGPVGVLVAHQAGGPVLAPVAGVEVAASPLATALLTSGTPKTLTLALASPAPPGLCVALASTDRRVATVPAPCVAVAEGATSVSFTVTPVATGPAVVTVTAGDQVIQVGVLVNQTLATHAEALAVPVGVVVATQAGGPVLAPVVGVEVAASPLATVLLSTPIAKTVTPALDAPAPPGLCVTLASSAPNVATVPAECVPVVEGATSVSFTVTPVATGPAVITATAGSQVTQVGVLVNQALGSHAEALAVPVGVQVAPQAGGPALAPVVGICVGGVIDVVGNCVR